MFYFNNLNIAEHGYLLELYLNHSVPFIRTSTSIEVHACSLVENNTNKKLWKPKPVKSMMSKYVITTNLLLLVLKMGFVKKQNMEHHGST